MINKLEITSPERHEYQVNKAGEIAEVTFIDYGRCHVKAGDEDLGSIYDIQNNLKLLDWYRREYRYLLKLCFGEIKNSKTKALEKKYRQDLEVLDKWFEDQKQKHLEERLSKMFLKK